MVNAPVTQRSTCRLCRCKDLVDLFSFGEQFVSDFPTPTKFDQGVRCPIDLVMCAGCSLVQLRHTAPQELLYSGHYWYRSGINQTMRQALADITAQVEGMVNLGPDDVVLDIGSNDGTLLRSYRRRPIKVGVEPARNLWDLGSEGVDHLIRGFWDADDYLALGLPSPRVVTAIGMMYDLEDPGRFVGDVARVLHPDGVFVAQLMCLRNMVNVGDVGNFCHEHLEYYSLKSLDRMLEVHGLEIFDVETNSVNGESYRLFIRHSGDRRIGGERPRYTTEGALRLVEARKAEVCLDQPLFYANWFRQLVENRDRCVRFVREQVKAGKRVWVYGASTKGNFILQWYGLGRDVVQAAADRSPEKWGRCTVGTGIPITSEDAFRAANPEFALVLPYAFLPEFLERERAWTGAGGRFIVPLPRFQVVP